MSLKSFKKKISSVRNSVKGAVSRQHYAQDYHVTGRSASAAVGGSEYGELLGAADAAAASGAKALRPVQSFAVGRTNNAAARFAAGLGAGGAGASADLTAGERHAMAQRRRRW